MAKKPKMLDKFGRYDDKEINAHLDECKANWDSYNKLDDGCMLAEGEFLVFLDALNKWIYIYEEYLNEWSSCYKVRYYYDKRVPKKLWKKADEYASKH